MSEEITAEIPNNVPVVLHEGRYRLYQKPDGGMRVQYRRDDKEEDDFFELPGKVVRLAKAAAEGKISPLALMREMMSMSHELHNTWITRAGNRHGRHYRP